MTVLCAFSFLISILFVEAKNDPISLYFPHSSLDISERKKVKSLSRIRLFVTPWTIAPRLLHPWDFPGMNTGVGFCFLLQGNLPDPGIEPRSPALWVDALLSELPGRPSLDIVVLNSSMESSSFMR